MPAAKRTASRSIKNPARAVAGSLLLASVLAPNVGEADLITDGYFNQVSRTATSPTLTTLFGEFGTGTGSTLTVAGWTTSGYNFVYTTATVDSGNSNGALNGAPNEAPGQYNAPNGYGSTYMWGSKNSGTSTFTNYTAPNGVTPGFIAADGAFQVGAVTQSISGLTVGNSYNLTFYWAGAQQQSFSGNLLEHWTVSLGNQSFDTQTLAVTSHTFSGWQPQQTFTYKATAITETLSFLAVGTNADGSATSQPPFLLLGGVSLNAVPEPTTWALCVGFGAACMLFEVGRRRRQRAALDLPLD